VKTVGFLGKATITDSERAALVQFGRIVGVSGRELIIVPAPGSVEAVEVGVNTEGGRVRRIAGGVLTESAHAFVFADERLLTRIRQSYPAFDRMRNVHLFSSELEIALFNKQMRSLLKERGIALTE
jgi:hypothetical protein